MIHWKISVLSVTLGAAATAGFVWLGRRSRKIAVPDAGPALDIEQKFDAEEAARADAFHDFELADREANRQEGREEIAELLDALEGESFDVGPVDADIEPADAELEISSLDGEPLSDGERYDAVDPERLGNEFLSRAIDAPPASPPVPEPFAAPPPDEGQLLDAARIEAFELPLTEEELERRRAAEAERNE